VPQDGKKLALGESPDDSSGTDLKESGATVKTLSHIVEERARVLGVHSS